MKYIVTVSKEILFEIEVEASDWENACELAEERFGVDARGFQQVDSQFEAVDYRRAE